MASTYTDIGTELMVTGENAGNWGTKTNTNLKIIEEAVRGYVAQSIAGGADTTALTYTDGSTGDAARNMVIALTGSITGNQVVTVTAKEKVWIVDNQTSGAYTVQFMVSGQTGVTWAATDKGTKILYCNGTDVIDTGITSAGAFDLDGNELILDADADTSITADTDDQIDFRIAGADDFTMTANAFNVLTGSHATFADSANAKFGTGNDMLVYHDGTNSYITNSQGALKVATETSGIAVTIGHTTSETTIADNLTVTGTLTGTLATAAQGSVTSLGTLTTLTVDNVITNGATIGHTSDIDLMTLADGVLTVAGELDATTLDISGNADIDGTTNLDAVDIDGAVQLDATLTIGANDQGYDVILYGDTASANVTWDTSADDLIFNGGAGLIVPDGQLTLGSTAVSSTATELNLLDGKDATFLAVPGKIGGTNFTGSLLIGHATTGTLSSAENNTGVGIGALDEITSGDSNTAVGQGTLTKVTASPGNTAVGRLALTLTTGASNTAVGRRSLQANSSGDFNTAIGEYSGNLISGNDANYNTLLGYRAGDNITSGAGNVVIGSVDAASATGDRQLKIAGFDGSTTTTWISGSSAGVLTFNAANVSQQALTSSSNAIAWDASAKPNAYHLTTENTTFSAPSNPIEGAFICIEINYNGSHTIAFNTVFEFAASTAPTFTSTNAKTDILVFKYSGAVWQEVGRTLNLSEA